jgi:hypothetical protein
MNTHTPTEFVAFTGRRFLARAIAHTAAKQHRAAAAFKPRLAKRYGRELRSLTARLRLPGVKSVA